MNVSYGSRMCLTRDIINTKTLGCPLYRVPSPILIAMLTMFLITLVLAINACVQAGPVPLDPIDGVEFGVLGKREMSLDNTVVKASNPAVPAINVKEEHLKKDVLGRPLVGKLGLGGGIIGGGLHLMFFSLICFYADYSQGGFSGVMHRRKEPKAQTLIDLGYWRLWLRRYRRHCRGRNWR